MSVYYVDGGGWTGTDCCFCVFMEGKKKPLVKIFYEEKSSNEMEFMAMLEALKVCENNSRIYSDSKIVVGHLIWGWESQRGKLKPLIEESRKFLKHKQCSIIWVPREKNKAGIILETRLEKIKGYKNASLKFSRRKNGKRK